MFFGTYNYSIDGKSRFRIPSKLKNELGKSVIISKGTNNCLFLFDKDYFNNQFMTKLNSIPTFSLETAKPMRAFLSSSFEVEEDSQGRLLLPVELKNFANIEKEIVFVGVGSRIEIWAKNKWEKYNNYENFDSILENLNNYNI